MENDIVKRNNQAGIVLIVTLWVIVVLSSVSLAFIRQAQLEAKMVAFQRDVTIVDSIAKAGIRQALILLREDKIKDSGEDVSESITPFLEEDNFPYDGGSEAWANNDELYVDVPFYEVGDKAGYYYVEVTDEASKFPINNPGVTLEMIAHLLETSGIREKEAMTLAGAIVDWKDQDDVPASLDQGGGGGNVGFGSGGDEASVYNSGRGRRRKGQSDIPEICMKNGELDSIDELLLIPGMTPDIIYGTVDPNENRSSRFGRRRMAKGEYLGLNNLMTVYESRFNLNTVKPEVMEAILYPIIGKDAEKLAQDWAEYRDGRDRETYTDDDNVLKTMENQDMDDVHWTEVEGFTPDVFKALQPFASNISNVFFVVSLAEYEGIEKGYRAVVERQYTPWEQMPVFGIDTNRLEDLEQVKMQIRLFEPVFDADQRIDRMS